MTVSRVSVNDAAQRWIHYLEDRHGPLLFHQSGGCCDGSSPMCYPRDQFMVGANDVYLGSIAGHPVYISGAQFEAWKHTHLTIDVVEGRGGGFSIEAPEGIRFLTRSRIFTEEESEELAQAGEAARGPQ